MGLSGSWAKRKFGKCHWAPVASSISTVEKVGAARGTGLGSPVLVHLQGYLFSLKIYFYSFFGTGNTFKDSKRQAVERLPSGRRGEKGTLLPCGWGCNWVGVITVETGLRLLETLSIELPHDPATPLLGNDVKKTKSIIRKDPCTPVFIAKTWKQRECPLTDEWMREMCGVYTMEYYSATKKKETMPFAATWTDPETVILNEVRQRQTSYNIAYMWSKKYANELFAIRNRPTDIEN